MYKIIRCNSRFGKCYSSSKSPVWTYSIKEYDIVNKKAYTYHFRSSQPCNTQKRTGIKALINIETQNVSVVKKYHEFELA